MFYCFKMGQLDIIIQPNLKAFSDQKRYYIIFHNWAEAGHKLDKFSQNYCSFINSAGVEWPQTASFDLLKAYSTVRGWTDEGKFIQFLLLVHSHLKL
ncbi:hypothetical protein HMPREF2811_04555 [Globicatella sp. HMSC072A10]|nr:hypothetical protein HMPREF2811_04555 [Globicatella sp. HMSC072A10]